MENSTPPEPSDEQLVEAVREGEASAASAIGARYRAKLLRFCENFLGDAQRAEEVVQETLARLSDGTEMPTGSLKPWLYRIARNRCLDIHRRHQRSPTHNRPIRTGFDAPRNTAGPGTRAAREERRVLIRTIIDEMPDEYRSVILMKHFEGLSRAEMAEVLGISEAAVKGRLARASEHLQAELARITGSAS